MADVSQSILHRLKDLYNNPAAYLEMVVDQLDNATRGREAVINREGARYRQLSPDERRKRMIEGSVDTVAGPLGGALGVIKNRGGNWLTGSVEKSLEGLKRSADEEGTAALLRGGYATPEQVKRVATLDKWIEGPLTKYVKRDMATNIPGVFAPGDCTGKPWQIAKATGEGLVAVFSAIQYLEQKNRQKAES